MSRASEPSYSPIFGQTGSERPERVPKGLEVTSSQTSKRRWRPTGLRSRASRQVRASLPTELTSSSIGDAVAGEAYNAVFDWDVGSFGTVTL